MVAGMKCIDLVLQLVDIYLLWSFVKIWTTIRQVACFVDFPLDPVAYCLLRLPSPVHEDS